MTLADPNLPKPPHFQHFAAPFIFLRRVKIGTSDLVGRFIIACPSLLVTNHPLKGRGQGHVKSRLSNSLSHFTFWPWGLTAWPKFTKIGDDHCYPPNSTTLPNFNALRQPAPEISITNFCGQTKSKQRNKETVNDISPACLSARGDNKGKNVNSFYIYVTNDRYCVEWLIHTADATRQDMFVWSPIVFTPSTRQFCLVRVGGINKRIRTDLTVLL